MRHLFILIALANTMLSLLLLYSAGQRFPQTSPETEELTASTGGRQVSIMAPAPTAPLQFAGGFIAAGLGLVCGAAALGAKTTKELPAQEEDDTTLEMPSFFISLPTQPQAPIPEKVPELPSINGWSSPLLDPERCPELNQIVTAGMLTVVGGQGAGKTTFVGGLIAARHLMGHKVVIFNHHRAFGEYVPFRVYGADGNGFGAGFVEIQTGLAALHREVESRYATRQKVPGPWAFESQPITVILEEFSDYSNQIEDAKVMSRLMASFTQDTRKAEIYVVLVVHDLSKAKAGGGVTGIVTNIKQSSPKVILGRVPAPRGFKPSGYCEVQIPGLANYKDVKVPHQSELLPNPENPLDFSSIAGVEPIPAPWEKAKPPAKGPKLTNKEQAVVELARGREFITVGDLLQSEIAETDGEARELFKSLGQHGMARLNLENTVMHLTTPT